MTNIIRIISEIRDNIIRITMKSEIRDEYYIIISEIPNEYYTNNKEM